VERALESPNPAKPPKSFKLLIILGVLIFLAAGGAAGLFFFLPESQENASVMARVRNLFAGDKKAVESTGPGYIYKMEPFLVNLLDPGQLRYLKVTLHAESNREKESEEIDRRLPQLRDAVLTILSSKNYKDIITAEGKSALREEIKLKLNQLLSGVKVENVYFTEFVVQ
jgi:flagellar protein FliL